MNDNFPNRILPPSIKAHLKDLKVKLGEDAGNDLEKIFLEMMKNLKTTAAANPLESSALFLARPTGYVISTAPEA